jgi:hypothetical protein
MAETLTVHTADELVAEWEARAKRLADHPHNLFDNGERHALRICAAQLGALLNAAREAERAEGTGATGYAEHPLDTRARYLAEGKPWPPAAVTGEREGIPT